MENIFENAYLGKPYQTRDGRKAIFYNHHNNHARERANYVTMILEGKESIYKWYYDGKSTDNQEQLDIISEWQEEVDEEELDKITNEQQVRTNHLLKQTEWRSLTKLERDIFKAGYRQAWRIKHGNI